MRNLPLLLRVLIILGLTLVAPSAIKASNGVHISDTKVEYSFGETIIFEASLQSEEPIDEVLLFLRAEGQADTEVGPTMADSEGRIIASYDLDQNPLRAFSQVYYWFRVKLQNGETYRSEDFNFFYEDNRFDWETLQDGPFHAHWYSGDVTFAQEVINTAKAGRRRAESLLTLSAPENIDIYVYSSAQDLQSTLNLSGQTWVAGHADPALGLIMVSLPSGPEQQLEMERQIPHELMHVMLYHTTGNGYDNLPAWLIEGLASVSELYPNPDYVVLLENAYQRENLIPIKALCRVFPRDASSALLAYAESASFTRYLLNRFGTPGLEELRQQYTAGLDCERGAEQALEVSLNRLEDQWRRDTFDSLILSNVVNELAPWLFILAALLAAPLFLIVRVFRDKSADQPTSI